MVCTVSSLRLLDCSNNFFFLEKSSCLNFSFFLPGGNTVCGPSVVSERKANENGVYLFTHFHLESRFYGK